MAVQVKNGKAFEYSLLKEFYFRLSSQTNVVILKNEAFYITKGFYEEFDKDQQEKYDISSSAAVNFLIDVEPRLSKNIDDNDKLQLEIVSDKEGQSGDVRDIILIRAAQGWSIGVSAKNNHRAVKHSRLSKSINFGEKWVGISCSKKYFQDIEPIFSMLEGLKKTTKNIKWDVLDKEKEVYKPILDAFKQELHRLDIENPKIFPQRLVEYLIGNKDFYKVIKTKSGIEIQAYNIHGSLNQSFKNFKPKAKIPRVKLPTRLIETVDKKDSSTTILVTFDEGWQISFRLHNASSRVEASLKFDINLISSPHTLFTNHIFINRN